MHAKDVYTKQCKMLRICTLYSESPFTVCFDYRVGLYPGLSNLTEPYILTYRSIINLMTNIVHHLMLIKNECSRSRKPKVVSSCSGWVGWGSYYQHSDKKESEFHV